MRLHASAFALLAAVTCGSPLAASSVTRTSAFDYDPASGLLVKEVVEPDDNSLCAVTHHVRDSLGRIQSTTVRPCNGSAAAIPGGTQEAPAPLVSSYAHAAPRQTGFTFTADSRFIATTTNAAGHVEISTYDQIFGVGTRLEGPNGLVTEWAYDAFGRKLLQKNPDGTGIKWAYQYCVSVPGGTDATCPTIAGAPGSFSVTETPVRGPIDLVALTFGAPNGPYAKTYFDALSRIIRAETQGSDAGAASRLTFVDTEYDALGRESRKSRPYFQGDTMVWSSATYDTLGRVSTRTEPMGNGAGTYTFGYSGLVTTSTDPLNKTTTESRDVAGQVTTITDAMNGLLTRTFDPLGNLVRTTDAKGNVTSIVYDVRGRRKTLYDPDMGVWAYEYNALGELVWQRDAKAQVATMSYDTLGRITARTGATQNSAWYYDGYANNSTCATGRGRLCETTSGNGFSRKHTYDSLGRLASTATTAEGVFTSSVTYNAVTGRVGMQTYPGGMQLRYDHTDSGLGYLWRVVDLRTNLALWTAGPSNANGQALSYTYGNGVVTNNDYYADGRINTTRAGVGGGGSVQMLAHTFDLAGRLDSRSDLTNGITASYGYDDLGRLKSETRSGGSVTPAQTIAWSYDSIGNMTTRTERGVTNTYNYPSSGLGSQRPHAVANVSGEVSGVHLPLYTYDANGNLMAGAGRSVIWTSFDKVQRIAKGDKAVEYAYDSDHERATEYMFVNGVRERTTVYLNPAAGAGLYFEQETGTAGLKRKHFVSVGGLTIGVMVFNGSSWAMRYWHQDHLGSVSAVTDEAGNMVERLGYEPFGKRRYSTGATDINGALAGVTTDRGFTGHEHIDEVGLVNMNGRVYDPGLGRFLSADPVVQSPGVLQSYNRYSYVWNSPLNSTDPSGYVSLHNEWTNLWHNQTVQAVVTVAIAYVSYGYGGAWYSAAYTAAYTGARVAYDSGSVEEGLKAGAISFATSAALIGVGSAISGLPPGEFWVAKVIGHAAVGCASASASGGDCGAGAAAGAVSAVSTPLAEKVGDALGSPYLGVLVAAPAGGLGAKLAGGKFSSGALTGAFGYLFNNLSTYEMDQLHAAVGNIDPASDMSAVARDLNTPRALQPHEDVLRIYGEAYFTVLIATVPGVVTEAALLRALPYALSKGGPYVEKLAGLAEGIGAKQIAKALVVVAAGAGGAGGKSALEAALQILRPAGQIVQRRNEVSAIKKLENVTSGKRLGPE